MTPLNVVMAPIMNISQLVPVLLYIAAIMMILPPPVKIDKLP